MLISSHRRMSALTALVAVAVWAFACKAEPPKPTDNAQKPGASQTVPPAGAKDAKPGPVPVGPPTATHGGAPPAPAGTVQLKPGEVPKCEFDTPTYDFGKAKTGKDVEHDYWFHNTGNGPLEILQVKPSCGCTTTSQYDKVVQPGQSGKIPIKVATGHATGPITKSITVTTNVPGPGGTIALQVKGELWQAIQATPNSALFGNVSAAQTKEGPMVRKLTIANNSESPVKLGELKSNNPAFKGEIKELEAGKKWEMSVTLAPAQPTGVQSGMIELDTGMADLPKLQVACSAYLVADVDVVPAKMMLPATRAVSLQRDFYVRNNGSKPIKLSDLSTSNPLMKASLTETQPGMAFRITMDVAPEYKVGKDGDQITFKTDHPNYPKITIPITEAPVSSAPPPIANGPPPAGAVPIISGGGKPASAVTQTVAPAKTPPAQAEKAPPKKITTP